MPHHPAWPITAVADVRLAALALAVTAWPAAAEAQDPGFDILAPDPPAQCRAAGEDRVRVLLVGSYHMSNPGLDTFNLEADDVLAAGRQSEIETLVDRLAWFEPTKVAVEAPWGDTLAAARYARYLAGDHELRRSEGEQIGFRLARQAGLDTVYAIDVRMSLDDSAMGPIVAANPQFQRKLGELEVYGQAAMQTMGRWLSEGTVGEMLYNMNLPAYIWKAHLPYIAYIVPVAEGNTYAGADMVTTWYQRNIRIFANITRITESADDRIFAIYGAGHVPIIRQLIIDSPDYCVEDPLPYLKE